MKFANAHAVSEATAKTVLFGADTCAAGHSQSVRGQSTYVSELRTPNFVRAVSHESPSLSLKSFHAGRALFDAGDVVLPAGQNVRVQIDVVKARFRQVLQAGQTPFCLGGDHLIKHAAIEALEETIVGSGAVADDCLLIYFDAHPDTVMKDAYSYQTVLHHALRRGRFKVEGTFIVGLRQVDAAEAAGLEHWRPQIVTADDFFLSSRTELHARFAALKPRFKKVYISIDLDGLDPSCAPAVEAPFPGGPTLAHLVDLIHGLGKDFRLVGLDISEFIPSMDPSRLTALTACRLLNEAQSCLA